MIVLMIDRKATTLEHRPYPTDTMIAIVGVLLQMVAEEKAFGGTILNINAKDPVRRRSRVARTFMRQSVSPIFLHPLESLFEDQIAGVPLRIAVDGVVPIFAQKLF